MSPNRIAATLGLLFLSFCSACSKVAEDPVSLYPIDSDSYGFDFKKPEESLRIMQWNIGHFSMGKSTKSSVTDALFYVRRDSFQNVFLKEDADIIALCEYSLFFTDTPNHPKCLTDTLLLNDYPFIYLGNNGTQRNFCFNTLFSKNTLAGNMTIEFKSNKETIITSSKLLSATDYYYIRSTITLGAKTITLIATHLAFDLNNPEIVKNQIKELIEVLRDEEYVIICGDFNTDNNNDYQLFADAGYSLANDGSLATFPTNNPYKPLDNIIVKGLHVCNVHLTPTFLSDHFPIVCDVVF